MDHGIIIITWPLFLYLLWEVHKHSPQMFIEDVCDIWTDKSICGVDQQNNYSEMPTSFMPLSLSLSLTHKLREVGTKCDQVAQFIVCTSVPFT